MYQPTAPCSPPSTNRPASLGSSDARNVAREPEDDEGHEEGGADQPAEKAMRPFPPIDGLELFQAHAALDLGIFRDLLIGLESVRPVGLAERRNRAHDRLPLGDGKARIGEPRGAADQDHGDDESRDRAKPDAQRPKLPRPRRGLSCRVAALWAKVEVIAGLIAGPRSRLNLQPPAPSPQPVLVLAGMRLSCRDASMRPAYRRVGKAKRAHIALHGSCRLRHADGLSEGGWRAEKRKILMAPMRCEHAGASRRANRGVFRQRALLSSGPSRINAPTEPSASSWQGLLVVPEGAPLPPGCLVATRPAGAAPRPAFATPRESAP